MGQLGTPRKTCKLPSGTNIKVLSGSGFWAYGCGHVGPGDVPQTLGQCVGPKGPKFHAQGKVLWMS